MMKTKIFNIFFLTLLVFLIVSCGEQHQHTFSDEWSSDNQYHWHQAICEHTDVIKDKAPHDGSPCTICKHVHEHTFANTWESDEARHWHSSTCGCNVIEDESYHSGYPCEICGYQHEHTYDESSYLSDINYHWYRTDCGHQGEKNRSVHHGNPCSDCGFEYNTTPTEGLEYELNGNEYTVTGAGNMTGYELIIPSTYNNLPVTAIKEGLFSIIQQSPLSFCPIALFR